MFSQDIITYNLIDDADVSKYFYVDPESGEISVRSMLDMDSQSTYMVSVASLSKFYSYFDFTGPGLCI